MTLEALSPHLSDPNRIAPQCEQLASDYRTVAADRMQEKLAARDSLKSPMTQLQVEPPIDWHHAAIQYLEIDAALRDLANNPATSATGTRFLETLRSCEPLLRFDQGRSAEGRAKYHSPANFDAEAFRTAVLGLFNVDPFKVVPPPASNGPNFATPDNSPGTTN